MVQKKIEKRKNKPGGGRRPMADKDRKDYAGLSKELLAWYQGIADERGVSRNQVIRQAAEWYRDAVENGRKMPVINRELTNAEVPLD
jgi:hypothetical protein